MRVPYTIPQQTLRAYKCSKETRKLLSEGGRRIQAEQKDWDASIVSSLKQLSITAIVQHFRDYNVLEVLPLEDFHRLLESLPVTLPFEITVPLVPDGEYWKRCAHYTWSSMNVVRDYGNSWRRLVVERTLERELEDALPAVLEEALRISRLTGHLVRRLRLRRLLQTAPSPLPSGWASDRTMECRELPMLDSELETLQQDLNTVLEYLVNLEELDIMFGMHDFEKNLSEPPNVVKVHCCQALGKALSGLPVFTRLRVRRSQLHTEKLAGLLEPLQACTSLTVLDVRNCYLGDRGVQLVAAFLAQHPALTVLRVANNKFGARGATCLAEALLQKSCAPLVELDLSLNSFGDVGGHNVIMALVPRDNRQELRDPAEDEDVRALMLAEQRAQEATSHDGVILFRGLVARAVASEVKSEEPASAHVESPGEEDWEAEQEQAPRQTAFLASVVQEARHLQLEAEEEEVKRLEEERLAREEAEAAADRWEGAPERLVALHMSGCRLGPETGEALRLLLLTNRVLNTFSVANNHLGEEACSAVAQAVQSNPHVQRLDLRMCGATWQDEEAVMQALRRNLAALRQPLRLQDTLREREDEHRVRMATTTEVLGRQWEREAPPRPRPGRPGAAVSSPSVTSGLSALTGTGSGVSAARTISTNGVSNSKNGLSQLDVGSSAAGSRKLGVPSISHPSLTSHGSGSNRTSNRPSIASLGSKASNAS